MPFNVFDQRLSEHFINTNSHRTLGKVTDNALAVSEQAFALITPGAPACQQLVGPGDPLGSTHSPDWRRAQEGTSHSWGGRESVESAVSGPILTHIGT